MKHYDYIFIGAGCAGLSLLTRMIAAGLTHNKHILVIDKSAKQTNDRTWCFWEDKPGFFEPIIYKQWNSTWFHSDNFSKQFNIAPYQYKMIRGIDFYNHCFDIIKNEQGIEIVNGMVSNLSVTGTDVQITIDAQQQKFSGAIVFNSLFNEAVARQQQSIYLLQHFKGWIIETQTSFFRPGEAVLMDFRTPQTNGTSFVYVLPLSDTKALVEYTLFSEKLLQDGEYKKGLTDYIASHLQLKEYTVTAEEFGIIPMTDAKFPWFKNGMYYIGTAGGQTKASSGYTFQFIQKQSDAILQQINKNTLLRGVKPYIFPQRFNFYDAILLGVLANKYANGSDVFTQLFKNNSPQAIFSFLDNETSFAQDLSIIKSLPTLPFLKAAMKKIF